MSSPAAPATASWRWTLRALRSRNYRLFFCGHGISVIGLWMTLVATPWLVYELTHSPLYLGLAGFLLRIPSFFLSPLAGSFLVSMRLRPPAPCLSQLSPWQSLKTGVIYVYQMLPLRAALLMVALASLMGSSYIVLGPVIAQEILQGGPQVFGWLMSASGSGALLATLYLASRPNILGLAPIIARAHGGLGIALVCFALSRSLWGSLASVFLVGFCLILHTVACNTWIQTLVEEDKRGRVMSLYSMAFVGMLPFGNLWSGYLADQIGVALTLGLCGSFCLVGALSFGLCLPQIHRQAHPIYQRLGLL